MEHMEHTERMPLNLQFFAEGAEEGGEAQATETGKQEQTGKPASGEDAQRKPSDLNGLLASDTGLQSQYDKLVSKALQTARGKWEREQGMTAEELAGEKTKEREAALTQKERELGVRERRAAALDALGQKGLPTGLVDCVALTDDDAMRASLEKAEKAFRASVDAAVKEKLQGAPPKGAGATDVASAAMRKALGLK